jgi:hypothetical protein
VTFTDCVPPPDKEQDAKALAECLALGEMADESTFEDFQRRMLDQLDAGQISGANCYRALVAMRQHVFGGPGLRFIRADGTDVPADDVIPF